jgi:hypothetical protein
MGMRSGISIAEVTSSRTRHPSLVRPLFGWAPFANMLFASILVPRPGSLAPLTTLFASHRP